MSNLRSEFLSAARFRLGAPFKNHYEPEDNCSGGRITSANCMEQGLVNEFDCSGLVIASLCDVLGIQAKEWPPEYRHANQLAGLERKRIAPYAGDVIIYHPDGHNYGIHVGIFVAKQTIVQSSKKAEDTIIHASEKKASVSEGVLRGSYSANGVVSVEKLLEIGSGNKISGK